MAVAQTIQYDNQHSQLEYKANDHQNQQRNPKKFVEMRPVTNPNFRYQAQQPNQFNKPNVVNAPPPMEIDGSGQFVQKTQYRPNDFQQMKRQREPSFQYANKQTPSFQHINKQQRVNHVDEIDGIQSVHGDSMDNNYEAETDDCQSTTSETQSIFLEE